MIHSSNEFKGIAVFSVIFFTVLLPVGLFAINLIDSIIVNDSEFFTTNCIEKEIANHGFINLPELREIEFYLSGEDQAYLYRLIPLDTAWNTTKYPVIRYTNLDGGRYELRIKNNQEASAVELPLKVEHNMLSIWWFQPLLTVSMLLIPFLVFYFLSLDRSRRSLQVEVIRNQIASDLHDDVGGNLSAVNILIDVLKRRGTSLPDNLLEIVDKMKSYTEETLDKLKCTVWAINPQNDSIDTLFSKLKDLTFDMISAKKIDVEFNNNYNPDDALELDMQQRHSLFLIFKEVINNTARHSKAKRVTVNIWNNKKSLFIETQDNGIGFDPEKSYAGNGLKNLQQRAKDNFIEFDLETAEGKGTKVQLEVASLN